MGYSHRVASPFDLTQQRRTGNLGIVLAIVTNEKAVNYDLKYHIHQKFFNAGTFINFQLVRLHEIE